MLSCIHFIRHGITQGILNKWYYGFEDLPLVDEGIKEIKDLKAQGIYPESGGSYYTSGMLRANQTLEAIYGKVPYTAIPDLKEMNFGQWECKTFDELQQLPGFDTWMNDRTGSFTFPGGESANIFSERAKKGLDELLGYHRLLELSHRHSGQPCISTAVCHGGVIAACMCHLFRFPAETFWDWIPAAGRGYSVYFEDSDPIRYENL